MLTNTYRENLAEKINLADVRQRSETGFSVLVHLI